MFLFSSVMLFYVDVGHLRRVHFIIYIMFLLFAFTTVPVVIPSAKLRRLSIYISIASLCSLIYTVVYSPRLFTSGLPESDNEIVRFVSSIPDRDNQRIFMLGEGLEEWRHLLHCKVLSRPAKAGIIIKTLRRHQNYPGIFQSLKRKLPNGRMLA